MSTNSVRNVVSSACASRPVARCARRHTDAGASHRSSLPREPAQPVASASASLWTSAWAASASFLPFLVVADSDYHCLFVLLHTCEGFSRSIPSTGTPGSWGVCAPSATWATPGCSRWVCGSSRSSTCREARYSTLPPTLMFRHNSHFPARRWALTGILLLS